MCTKMRDYFFSAITCTHIHTQICIRTHTLNKSEDYDEIILINKYCNSDITLI